MKQNRKILILILLISVLSAWTIASASKSSFEGFPTVNVIIDGKNIQGDVPAINFHGRTMVPIGIVSEELGAIVNWDKATSTVKITSNNNEYSRWDIDQLALYCLLSARYDDLESYGDYLVQISNYLNENMLDSTSLALISLKHTKDDLNKRIEHYNDLLKTTNHSDPIIADAKRNGIDVLPDMNIILGNYRDAIECYKLAIKYLTDYKFNFRTPKTQINA